MSSKLLLPCLAFLLLPSLTLAEPAALMSAEELPTLGNPAADARIAYGDDPLQFADLWLPDGDGPHPVIIMIHGGCWLSDYDISYMGKFSRQLAAEGFAVWSLEYRRVGNQGGGWPGTFQDIASGADHLLHIASQYELDTGRVVAAGHSAGGHLALWLGARKRLSGHELFTSSSAVEIRGILALAPAPDLGLLHEKQVCGHVIDKLMGGSPLEFPERYALGSAIELLPIGARQVLITGTHDKTWKPVGEKYYEKALQSGDEVTLVEAPESGHFEMIDPGSSTWPLVLDNLYKLLGMTISADY